MKKNSSIRFLARKYLAARSKHGLGKAQIFTLIGISLGVMALFTVSSVMNGFREDISGRIIATLSQMRLSAKDNQMISGYGVLIDEIEKEGFSAAPVLRHELVLSQGSQAQPSICFGIDIDKHKKLSPILSPATADEGIVYGRIDPAEFAEGGIALGLGLAQSLGAYVGDEIMLISPIFNIPTAFGLLPRVQTLKVQAIFSAGMPEYDAAYSYIPLKIAQDFGMYPDVAEYIEIRGADHRQSRKYQKRLRPLFPQYLVEDWSTFDSSLYFAIRFEKFLMFVILTFMFIIASFNLTGSQLKMISQKKRELGLLKALGYEERDLKRLFLYQGLILCTLGIALGILLALILLKIQLATGLIKLADAIVLPVSMQVADLIIVIILSYILTVVSVQLPLKRLKSINAVELIRRQV